MPALQDWAELARSTIRSLTRADVTGFYSREWLQVRRELVSQHRQEIDSERRRWKRWIRTANAIVFGLTRRLAPVRRIVFAAALLIALNGVLQLVPLPSSRSWGLKGPDAVVELTVAFLLVEFLLAMELIDKLAYRDELVLARDLQAALVTGSLPEHPNFELGAFNRSANMVGGDLYEFVSLPDGSMALLFGDASGHGMAAGLVMAVAHAGFRTQLEVDPSPRAMVRALNRILCATGGTRSFFSAVYVLARPDGSFAATVAGHPPPVIIGCDGTIRARLGVGSYPLGIRPALEWEPIEAALKSGETLLLYSDGLYETCDAGGNAFGEERVESLVHLFGGASPEELVRELAQHVLAFCAGRAPEDDVSIAAVRFKPAIEDGGRAGPSPAPTNDGYKIIRSAETEPTGPGW
jgi:serine phosphatase RsbU (regulator of sigma subunit)